MLSPIEIGLFAFALVIILPLAIFALITGVTLPPDTRLGKYYAAEKYLMPAGNFLLLTLGVTAATKLALHFGFIDADYAERIDTITNVPFLFFLVIYLALWIKAYRKVRQPANNGA